MTDNYTALRNVLDEAFKQASAGKGAERHANGKPWTEQPIFTIAGQVGDGFNVGQVIKKVQEAQQMAARGEHSKAQHEVLGAIVYAASLHVLWGQEVKPKPDMGWQKWEGGESPLLPADFWQKWEGGECPVLPTDFVIVKYADGWSGSGMARNQNWRHTGLGSDVIAYRLSAK